MSNDHNKKKNSEISEETLRKLEEASQKSGLKINDLISSLLENKKPESVTSKENIRDTAKPGEVGSTSSSRSEQKNIEVIADLSKLLPFNNPEMIELLRRMTQSIENIEREHAQGWSDQRIDLQSLSKKLDKLM